MTSFDRGRGRDHGGSAPGKTTADRGRETWFQPARAVSAAPGKQTLTQAIDPAVVPAPDRRTPLQRQDDDTHPIVPADVQVDQYQQGTDPHRFKDCGPACIVMALRMIGVEDKLREHLDRTHPGAVTLEQELEHVRSLVDATVSNTAMGVGPVRQALIAVLDELGVSPTIDLQGAFKLLGDDDYVTTRANQSDGVKPRHAQAFLQAACVDGSAAMVMGLPDPTAWGWGGDHDNTERRLDPDRNDGSHQLISDQGGSHFVLVWHPEPIEQQDNYVVMDPSWPAPKPDIKIEQIMAFIEARDRVAKQPTRINIMKIPFAQVASYLPRAPGGGFGGGANLAAAYRGPAHPELGAVPAAPVAGARQAVPRQVTQRKGDGSAILTRLGEIQRTWVGWATSNAATDTLRKPSATVDIASTRSLLSRDTETVAELAGSVTDTDIAAAATAANDAIVAAYQLLAVLAADGTARTWQQSDDGARRKLVNSLRDPQGTPRDNYCGEMVRSELISAGLADFTDASGSSHFTQIFDHADNVEAFFRYTEDNFRNPAYILPYNDPRQGWMPVADYHALRHSKRALVEPATVTGAQTHGTLDSVMRPGDVATLYYGTQTTSDPAHADHTVLVRRVINGRKFETIEGNSYVTDSAGNAVGNGIGTNEWDTGPTGRDPSQTFHNDVHNRYAKVFLLGRLSVVDFETGHGYSLTDPGQSGSATQGTSSDRAGARSARRNRADL